ncbi:MAG: prepilin-type N-terminal cleavage/methylation domain-containing protein [Opitutaceae bacterium]|nr:prepilin-type N-terminal cleavage/methylation domain-containing protein [Opitutaceae bacterium]
MTTTARSRSAGFTISELLVGITLSGLVMAAVLSSYVYLGRNFARLMNQQTLESEGRRTVQTFARDVRMAEGFSGTPTATQLTLVLPAGNVTYAYDNTNRRLTRTPAGGSALVLLRNTTDNGCSFLYYDIASREYSNPAQFTPGIKQVALSFTTQTGVAANFTRTGVYTGATQRLLLRNKGLLEP